MTERFSPNLSKSEFLAAIAIASEALVNGDTQIASALRRDFPKITDFDLSDIAAFLREMVERVVGGIDRDVSSLGPDLAHKLQMTAGVSELVSMAVKFSHGDPAELDEAAELADGQARMIRALADVFRASASQE